MRGVRLRLREACVLLACAVPSCAVPSCVPLVSSARAAAQAVPAVGAEVPVRIFFISDVHSNEAALERIIADANRERPHVVLDGGDFVHDGTESEFRRSLEARAGFVPPWYVVRGNHDALLRGPFDEAPPQIASLRSFTLHEIHFIMLDNASGELGVELMNQLRDELEANGGRRVVVVLHIPPFVDRKTLAARLRHLVPFHLESPVMTDAAEVERFTALLKRHRVLAVLTGHTHAFEHGMRGGVHYVIAGTAGGLTPGWGVGHEYLDISIDGRDLTIRRVGIRSPPGNPVTLVSRTFGFYRELNRRNHAMQGWNYTPSASVQLRASLQRVEARGREDGVVHVGMAFERLLGAVGRQSFTADVGLLAGPGSAAADLTAGFRVRLAGDYNRGAYAGAGATANAGLLAGHATAGVGARLGAGVEWHAFTIELAGSRLTNHRAAVLTVGRRY